MVADDVNRTAPRPGPSSVEQACRATGLRMTGQRRVIARVLDEAQDYPDALDLHRRASAVDARISLATVYRTLKLLAHKGIVEKLTLRDSRSRYERASAEHNDYLIDIKTGEVVAFRSKQIEKLQREIARNLGFRVVSHRLELYGEPIESAATIAGWAPK